MGTLHVISGAAGETAQLVVRKITFSDLKEALAKGFDDFLAMRTHVIPLSLIYPIVGIVIARLSFGYDMMPVIFPLVAGFALIGPFAAIGLYELSRRREEGIDTSWSRGLEVLRSSSIDAIVALGILLLILFVVWLAVAQALYQSLFGYGTPNSVGQFLTDIFTTREGWTLIVTGHVLGFLFALAVFTISVVSFPLLVDHDVGAAVALHTSIKAVLVNPVVLAAWALFIAVALMVGSLPFLVGLAIVMPVLGHASWHLYRKVVAPDPSPHPKLREPKAGNRYAAEFPVSLLPWVRSDK